MREAQPLEFRLGFAQRFREALRQAGYWTGNRPAARRFAQEQGYDLATVSRWMNGGAIPEHWRITQIARALHVLPGWLLFGEGEGKGLRHPFVSSLAALLLGWGLLAGQAQGVELSRGREEPVAQSVVSQPNGIPLIGRWLGWLASHLLILSGYGRAGGPLPRLALALR